VPLFGRRRFVSVLRVRRRPLSPRRLSTVLWPSLPRLCVLPLLLSLRTWEEAAFPRSPWRYGRSVPLRAGREPHRGQQLGSPRRSSGRINRSPRKLERARRAPRRARVLAETHGPPACPVHLTHSETASLRIGPYCAPVRRLGLRNRALQARLRSNGIPSTPRSPTRRSSRSVLGCTAREA